MLVSLPKTRKDMTLGAVPVTIVSSLPQAAPAPAPEAAEPATEDAAPPPAPEPEPQPAPQPTPPPPAPPPPKKAPAPQPVPPPKKVQTPPAKTPPAKSPPPKTAPAKQDDALDLSALQKSLTRGRPTAAPLTNSRTAPRAGAGGPPQSAVSALAGRIQDNWILNNCDIAVAEGIEVTVTFSLNNSGRVSRGPELKTRRADAVWTAAARNALSAVRAGEPYTDLPRELFNQDYEFTFKAAEACRGR